MGVVLSLDIGGANTKYVAAELAKDQVSILESKSVYFPFWQKKDKYPEFLAELKKQLFRKYKPITDVIFVTTAELADCFHTKREGIAFIFNSVEEVFGDLNPKILDIKGQFLIKKAAIANWIDVAASNWFASAKYIGSIFPNSIMVDIGSTTTDIIPINQGNVVSKGKNDLERLIANELVFSGLLRTNVATLAHSITYQNREVPLSSELFATTGDIYLLLDDIEPSEFTVPTANNKPATKKFASARLARIICADTNQITKEDILKIAKQLKQKQLETISSAFQKIFNSYQANYNIAPQIILIGSGAKVIGTSLIKINNIKNVIYDSKIIKTDVQNCFSAYATLMLYLGLNKTK